MTRAGRRNPIDATWGEKLRARRQMLGLSQEDVASRTKISRRTLALIEAGHTDVINIFGLQKLAHALNSEPSLLISELPAINMEEIQKKGAFIKCEECIVPATGVELRNLLQHFSLKHQVSADTLANMLSMGSASLKIYSYKNTLPNKFRERIADWYTMTVRAELTSLGCSSCVISPEGKDLKSFLSHINKEHHISIGRLADYLECKPDTIMQYAYRSSGPPQTFVDKLRKLIQHQQSFASDRERSKLKRAHNPSTLDTFLQSRRKRRPGRITSCAICGSLTREGKPYCIEHVYSLDYATKVSAQNKEIEDELALVARRGSSVITRNSPVVAQILNTLAIEDGLDITRVGWDSDVPRDVISAYISKMNLWGLVEVIPENKERIVFLREPGSPPLMTAHELASYLNIIPQTILRSVPKGAPVVLIGKRKYFDPRSYAQWREGYIERARREKGNQFSRQGRISQENKVHSLKKQAEEEAQEQLLTVEELAHAMGVSKATVRYWITKGAPNQSIGENIRGRGAIRVFKLEEIERWYANFKQKADEIRKKATLREDWDQIIKDTLESGVAFASEKHRVHSETIRRKIRMMETLPVSLPGSSRTVGVEEASQMLGIKPITIRKWIDNLGAPHNRVTLLHHKRDRILVDPVELKKWYEQRKLPRKGRKRTLQRRKRIR